MLKQAIVLALGAILLVGSCNGSELTRNGRHLTLNARRICIAVASLQLVVTEGSCSGNAVADCDVIKSKLGLVVDAYNGWFANDGLCDEAKAEAAADTISNIVSTLWLETAVKIRCEENTGFGCGWSAASSPAWVEGVEKALQAAAEDAKAKDIGFCVADITDLAAKGGIDIEASRKAVCTNGGTEEEMGEEVNSVLKTALITAFTDATSSSCGGGEKTTCKGLKPTAKREREEAAKKKPKKEAEKETEGEAEEEVEQEGEVEQEPEKDADKEPGTGSTVETAGSAGARITVDADPGQEDVDTIDILGDADLDDIIIVAPPEIQQQSDSTSGEDDLEETVSEGAGATEAATDEEEESSENDSEDSCTCAEDVCSGATCKAFPVAKCKTVPVKKDCSRCKAQFLIDDEKVTCSIRVCKPKGLLCSNKSLAKCCGVCCKCESYAKIIPSLGNLEFGFCQNGPICDCLSKVRGHIG